MSYRRVNQKKDCTCKWLNFVRKFAQILMCNEAHIFVFYIYEKVIFSQDRFVGEDDMTVQGQLGFAKEQRTKLDIMQTPSPSLRKGISRKKERLRISTTDRLFKQFRDLARVSCQLNTPCNSPEKVKGAFYNYREPRADSSILSRP